MEFIWYLLAAIGAGIGTGFAGLSAATVMVPILITLCPSFSNTYGTYQATAIALASDVLGSAVTTATYAKDKNIDLKRGWILLVCILTTTISSLISARFANRVSNRTIGRITSTVLTLLGAAMLILRYC